VFALADFANPPAGRRLGHGARAAPAVRLSRAGDAFVTNMHHDEFGDYQMHNEVVEYDAGRRLAWEPARVAATAATASGRSPVVRAVRSTNRRAHAQWDANAIPCVDKRDQADQSTQFLGLEAGCSLIPHLIGDTFRTETRGGLGVGERRPFSLGEQLRFPPCRKLEDPILGLTQLQRLIDYGVITGMSSPADVLPLARSEGTRAPRTSEELTAFIHEQQQTWRPVIAQTAKKIN